MSYLKHLPTGQQRKIREDQVPNSAGGFVFAVDQWTQLDRFLILGTVGGTYYIGERDLTKENLDAVQACIDTNPMQVVQRVVEISEAGRATKNEPALLVLALVASCKDMVGRAYALAQLNKVARTGTHLFIFVTYLKALRGFGRSVRSAVANWYNRPIDEVAYQVVKYRNRNGWTHADVLRQSHVKPVDEIHNALFKWVVDGEYSELLDQIDIIEGFKRIQADNVSPLLAANIIDDHHLPREAVPTQFLNDKDVWGALLDHMPLTALIRNLGNMSKAGLLVDNNYKAVDLVVRRLTTEEQIRRARIHPLQALVAMKTYQQGHGMRGHGEWEVVDQVVHALEQTFMKSFKTVEPTNKRYLLALDVSGSMTSEMGNMPFLQYREASAVMSMVTARVEPQSTICAFSHGMIDLHIGRDDTLSSVVDKTYRADWGGTDCSLPMMYALENGLDIDVFSIYTDSETWAGRIHPFEALKEYRRRTGINAKMAVVGMAGNRFSIADLRDPGMIDFVGYDTDTPAAIAAFALL